MQTARVLAHFIRTDATPFGRVLEVLKVLLEVPCCSRGVCRAEGLAITYRKRRPTEFRVCWRCPLSTRLRLLVAWAARHRPATGGSLTLTDPVTSNQFSAHSILPHPERPNEICAEFRCGAWRHATISAFKPRWAGALGWQVRPPNPNPHPVFLCRPSLTHPKSLLRPRCKPHPFPISSFVFPALANDTLPISLPSSPLLLALSAHHRRHHHFHHYPRTLLLIPVAAAVQAFQGCIAYRTDA